MTCTCVAHAAIGKSLNGCGAPLAPLLCVCCSDAALQGGDSGELATEGCTFGVAHPPGYPLLTMLANVMAMMPRSEGTATVFTTNVFNAGA